MRMLIYSRILFKMIYPLYVYLRSSVTIIRLLKSIGKTSQMNNSVCVSICIAYMFILHTRSELLVVQKDHALCMERDLPLISLIIVLIGVNLCVAYIFKNPSCTFGTHTPKIFIHFSTCFSSTSALKPPVSNVKLAL